MGQFEIRGIYMEEFSASNRSRNDAGRVEGDSAATWRISAILPVPTVPRASDVEGCVIVPFLSPPHPAGSA